MMSKAPRWPEVLANTKIHKPTQKKGGKETSSLPVPVANRSKQADSTAAKITLNGGRSNSISNGDGREGATLKRSSHQGREGLWVSRPSSRPSRPAPKLCSSRSFSSLHTSSLTTAPFMRSSRSLNRLDKRSAGDESDENAQVKKDISSGSKKLFCKKLSTSKEPLRTNKGRCRGDIDEKKAMSSSSETLESSSSEVSSTACFHHGDKVKKENKDGGYSLVTTTKNVRPELESSQSKLNNKDDSKEEHQETTCHEGAEDSEKSNEGVIKLQQKMEETSAEISSVSSPSLSPTSSPCTDSSSPINPIQHVEDGKEGSPFSPSCAIQSNEDSSDQERHPCESDRGQLVKELEQTQKELSRLQQLNGNLQHELQHERERHLSEKNELLFNSSPTSEPVSTLRRLQKMNQELRAELETQKRTHEEAREAELRKRVDLLAQQAQLLVTGDATALAEAHLEQERKWFHEQRVEWERSVTSLKTELNNGEEKWKASELRLLELQEESYSRKEEVEVLRKALREATVQLRANEDAQAQKETLLQKHLALLQASQDRERKSLSASLARSEQHSQELQERLDLAEQQVESFDTVRMWSRDIEENQKQLQEELASSVVAAQECRDEKERLEQRCQELQKQLSETHEEVSGLHSCLKTEQTHYQDLKDSHESISEELLDVLEKTQQREAEIQETCDGFQRLLDIKEQELNEVLLKMEVLGNSLEETEAQLNEMLRVCTCASSHVEEESLEAEETVEPHLTSDSRSEDMFSTSPNDESSNHHARVRSYSLGPSHQYIITSGDDPERFTSAIQLLETKLFVTEEKLREITEQLEEDQDHQSCPELTRSLDSARRLSLLLQSQTEANRRFARETETFCGLLAGRFQLALNIVRSCREKLETSTAIELTDFERRLSAVEACLQQGQNDAEKQKHASFNAYRAEDTISSDVLTGIENRELAYMVHSEDSPSVGEYLMRELIIVEKILAALRSPNEQLTSLVPKEDGMSVANTYKNIISQILTLNKTRLESSNEDHELIVKACSEAELIYAAFKIQHHYQKGYKSEGPEDTCPTDFTPQSERENKEGLQCEKKPPWLEGLVTRLQRRAQFVWQLSQEMTCMDENYETTSVEDIKWMQEQAKLVYLSDRLYLDLEQEQRRRVVLQDKLQALCKQQDASLKDEREVFNHTLCELKEDNREELEHAEGKIISMEMGDWRLCETKQRIEDCHEKRTQKQEFQKKIQRHIHEEETQHLQEHHMEYFMCKEKHTENRTDVPSLHEGSSSLAKRQEVNQNDFEKHQLFNGEPFTCMEEMKRQLPQHGKQAEKLEKEQPKLEETATKITSNARIKTTHKDDLENGGQPQHAYEIDDIAQIHTEYQKAIELLNKDLEVLSLQHTQKCLENSQLKGELQFERKSFRKRRESQESKPEQSSLHAFEADLHFLRQEVFSLRKELKLARMDTVHTPSKMRDFYKNHHDEPYQGIKAAREDLTFATLPSTRITAGQNRDGNTANTSNAASMKKTDKPSLLRRLRAVRSKSLKEGFSGQEKTKLFD
ncbi:myosin-9 [Corythoichthys intestinalis]|uniref:myosin-9 n=1 Tax=Corythoichthys intestinalis TaxID=161448 RepID=UPI0025A50F04|nr:myosin-9 [Corythoichthys intestinalis]